MSLRAVHAALLAPVAWQLFCVLREYFLACRCIFVADGQVVAKGSNKTNTKRNVRRRDATAGSRVVQALHGAPGCSLPAGNSPCRAGGCGWLDTAAGEGGSVRDAEQVRGCALQSACTNDQMRHTSQVPHTRLLPK